MVFPYCIELFCVRFSLCFQKLLYHIFYSGLNQERWNKCSVVELQQYQRTPARVERVDHKFLPRKALVLQFAVNDEFGKISVGCTDI